MYICKYINGNWGFRTNILIKLVKTLLIPCILYGCQIWLTKNNLQIINSCLYKYYKSIISAVLNLDSCIAECIISIPPIEILVKIENIKHYMKITQTSNSNMDLLKKDIIDILSRHNVSNNLMLSIKDLYVFYSWTINQQLHHFSVNEIDTIRSRNIHDFGNLSSNCMLTENKIFKLYTIYIWQKTIDTKFSNEAHICAPKVSLNVISFPNHFSRKDEVNVTSLFYKNNLLNYPLFQVNPRKFPNPFCSHGCIDEETSQHIICYCIYNPFINQNRQLISDILGSELASINSFVTLLNCRHSKEFMILCLNNINWNINFRTEIIL